MLFAACNISHRGRELQRTKLLCCQPRQGWRKTENEGEREREGEGGQRKASRGSRFWCRRRRRRRLADNGQMQIADVVVVVLIHGCRSSRERSLGTIHIRRPRNFRFFLPPSLSAKCILFVRKFEVFFGNPPPFCIWRSYLEGPLSRGDIFPCRVKPMQP